MAGVILDTLPLALGIALNPLAIVVGILILRAGSSPAHGIAFALGWIAGLTMLLVLSTRIVRGLTARREPPAELPAVIWIGIGVLLLVAAGYTLRRRSPPDASPTPQRWLRGIEHGSVARMLGIGLFLSVVSLRNLTLLAAAAGVIGGADLAIPALTVAVTVFVAVSSIGILVPLLVDLRGGAGADATLQRWGDGLIRHMGTMTGIVLLVLGAYLVGKGAVTLF